MTYRAGCLELVEGRSHSEGIKCNYNELKVVAISSEELMKWEGE